MSLTHVKELEAFAQQTINAGSIQAILGYLNSNSNNADATYSDMSIALFAARNNFSAPGVTSARILVTLPDGTTIFDSSKGNNSRLSITSKSINENHNSRLAIMAAGLSQSGIGMEKKYSSSTGLNEQYLAHRIGKTQQDAIGCIRWSLVA